MSSEDKQRELDGQSSRGKGIAAPQDSKSKDPKSSCDQLGRSSRGHDLPFQGKEAAVSALKGETEPKGPFGMGPSDHFKFKLKIPKKQGPTELPHNLETKSPEVRESDSQSQEYEIALGDNGLESVPSCYSFVEMNGQNYMCLWDDQDQGGLQDGENVMENAETSNVNVLDSSGSRLTATVVSVMSSAAHSEGSLGDQNLQRQMQAESPLTSSSVSSLASSNNPHNQPPNFTDDLSDDSDDQTLQGQMQAESLNSRVTIISERGEKLRRPRKEPVGNKRQLTIPSMFNSSNKRAKETSSSSSATNDLSDDELNGNQSARSNVKIVSNVWKYFIKTKVSAKCKLCPFFMATAYPTNARNHLRVHHWREYQEVQELDAVRQEKFRSSSTQLTLPDSLKAKNKYGARHPKQQRFRQGLAWFVACTTASYCLTQSSEFKKLLQIADPLLAIPARDTIRKDVEKTFQKCVAAVKDALSVARKITISSDIWTKRGQRSSFLGITATFYHPELKKKYHVALAAKKFESVSHESKDIVREMRKALQKFQVPAVKVWAAMTDGGSNMICSHRADMQIFAKVKPSADVDGNDDEAERIEDEELEIEEMPVPELSVTFSSASLEENKGVTNEEDYTEFDMEMPNFYEHLVCVIHSTITCLNKLEDLPEVGEIVEDVKKILGKFNKSPNLCQDLAAETSLALLNFPSTRWNYIYLTFERLLRVRAGLEKVLRKAEKTKYLLNDDQWAHISSLTSLLKPFHEKTCMASKDKAAVSSEVLPALLDLQFHVKNHRSNNFLRPVCDRLLCLLESKFSKFLDEHDVDFKGTYLAATLLDPRYRIVLSDEQRAAAKRFILSRFKEELDQLGFDSDTVFNEDLSVPVCSSVVPYPGVAELKNQMLRKRMTPACSQLHTFTTDLERYLQNLDYDKELIASDPLAFWISRENEYAELAPTALDYLCIPSSTADVERLFSRGGIATQGIRNRLDGKNLEMEIFLSQNRNVFEELGVALE